MHWKAADFDPGSHKFVKIGKQFSSELLVQNEQNSVYGVETPHPRSFVGSGQSSDSSWRFSSVKGAYIASKGIVVVVVGSSWCGIIWSLNGRVREKGPVYEKRLYSIKRLLHTSLHEQPLGIYRVSNPSTQNSGCRPRLSVVSGTNQECTFGSELMIQINRMGGTGVESPLPKTLLGGRCGSSWFRILWF